MGFSVSEESVIDPGMPKAPQEYVQRATTRTPAAAARPGRRRGAPLKLKNTSKTASKSISVANFVHRYVGGGAPRGRTIGVANPRAIVVNVTVALAAFEPSSVTDCGETAQPGPAGATMHVQVTVWSNPCAGAAETVKFACCPALIVLLDGNAETL